MHKFCQMCRSQLLELTCHFPRPECLKNLSVDDDHDDKRDNEEHDCLEAGYEEHCTVTPRRITRGKVPEDVLFNTRKM